MWELASDLRGADEVRNSAVRNWVHRSVTHRGACAYDSAVIAGNGIGALAFAAHLARNPRFAGKVTVVAPPAAESRRLINGVSVRGIAADFMAAVLNTTHDGLMQIMSGSLEAAPVAYRQTAAMAVPRGSSWQFTRRGQWQAGATAQTPVVYGLRNSRVVAGMGELARSFPIDFVDARVESAAQLRSLSNGRKPLLVNATTNPGLLGGESKKPQRMVLAVQVPFIAGPGGVKHPLQPQTAFAPLIRRKGIIDVGYFTPFRDPMSPRSDWYGIVARVVDSDSGFDKDEELQIMTDELLGMAAAMGLSPDDIDETLAKAMVPASPWGKIAPSGPGTLELKRHYSGGAPAFYADGITSALIGGAVGAEAIIHGANADEAVRSALRRWRRHNFLWFVETNKIAGVADLLMRINVPAAMFYPHTVGAKIWSSAA
ncbi:MAG: hypothetical protein KDM81_09200 [Verrucomicrobiae bacterium]|nr:hypothetical protein [Verrucomicrobiae bacterium]